MRESMCVWPQPGGADTMGGPIGFVREVVEGSHAPVDASLVASLRAQKRRAMSDRQRLRRVLWRIPARHPQSRCRTGCTPGIQPVEMSVRRMKAACASSCAQPSPNSHTTGKSLSRLPIRSSNSVLVSRIWACIVSPWRCSTHSVRIISPLGICFGSAVIGDSTCGNDRQSGSRIFRSVLRRMAVVVHRSRLSRRCQKAFDGERELIGQTGFRDQLVESRGESRCTLTV